MRQAVVTSSGILASGRLDARYHVLRKTFEARASELAERIPAEIATERLLALTPAQLKALLPLSRRTSPTNADAQSIVRQEPHLALAIVESVMSEVKAGLRARIEGLNGQVRAVDALFEDVPTAEGEPAGPSP